jgi:GNAT superfamily N-acetyltransferase
MVAAALSYLPFGPEHIDGAVHLSSTEGWPHQYADWALFLGISSGIVVLEGNRVVGTGLVSPFGDVASLSMILVERSMRGRGIGRGIMEKLMALATPDQWRLVATESGRPLYARLGFESSGVITRLQGVVRAEVAERAKWSAQGKQAIRPALNTDLAAMAALDLAASGMARHDLLAALLNRGQKQGLVLEEREGLLGFALLRPFGPGHVIGPVVASSCAQARALYTALLSRLHGQFVRTDLYTRPDLADQLMMLGLDQREDSVRMCKNKLPFTQREAAFSAPYGPFSIALAAQAVG